MKLWYKLRKQKPEKIILLSTDRDAVTIDATVVSTREILKSLRTMQWSEMEAYIGGAMAWRALREDVDDWSDDDDDDSISRLSVPSPPGGLPPAGMEPFVSPERWLSLMLQAQVTSTTHHERVIQLLLDAMTQSNERSQELLNQAHNQLVVQGEQVERLLERLGEDKDEEKDGAWEDKIEKIVEGLAPVVLPLLMKAGAAPPPDAPQPARKGSKHG
jgi:hypothetical protein